MGKKQKHLRDGGESKPRIKSLSNGINFNSGKKQMQQIKHNYSSIQMFQALTDVHILSAGDANAAAECKVCFSSNSWKLLFAK